MKHSSAEKCKFSSKAKVSLSVNCNNVYGISQKHYWFCFIAHIYFDVELRPYWRNVLFGRESSFKKNERFVNAWFSFRNVDIFQNFLHNIKKWSYFSQIISSIHLRILCKANELQNIEKSITERLHLEKKWRQRMGRSSSNHSLVFFHDSNEKRYNHKTFWSQFRWRLSTL